MPLVTCIRGEKILTSDFLAVTLKNSTNSTITWHVSYLEWVFADNPFIGKMIGESIGFPSDMLESDRFGVREEAG